MPPSSLTRSAIYLALASALFAPTSAFSQTQIPLTLGSYAIQGSVTYTSPLLGIGSETTDIGPVLLSQTTANGSNTQTSGSVQGIIFGIPIYNMSNISNTSTACDTSTCDSGSAGNSIGSISLFGGLITITNLQDTLTANVVDKKLHYSTSATGTLGGTGWNSPSLSLNGTSYPVSGNIPVPLLDVLGIQIGTIEEPFTGTATLGQVLKTTNTSQGTTTDVVILDVQGTVPDSLLTGSYQFNLEVAGPFTSASIAPSS